MCESRCELSNVTSSKGAKNEREKTWCKKKAVIINIIMRENGLGISTIKAEDLNGFDLRQQKKVYDWRRLSISVNERKFSSYTMNFFYEYKEFLKLQRVLHVPNS